MTDAELMLRWALRFQVEMLPRKRHDVPREFQFSVGAKSIVASQASAESAMYDPPVLSDSDRQWLARELAR